MRSRVRVGGRRARSLRGSGVETAGCAQRTGEGDVVRGVGEKCWIVAARGVGGFIGHSKRVRERGDADAAVRGGFERGESKDRVARRAVRDGGVRDGVGGGVRERGG